MLGPLCKRDRWFELEDGAVAQGRVGHGGRFHLQRKMEVQRQDAKIPYNRSVRVLPHDPPAGGRPRGPLLHSARSTEGRQEAPVTRRHARRGGWPGSAGRPCARPQARGMSGSCFRGRYARTFSARSARGRVGCGTHQGGAGLHLTPDTCSHHQAFASALTRPQRGSSHTARIFDRDR